MCNPNASQMTIGVADDRWSRIPLSFVPHSPPPSKPLYNLHSSESDLLLINPVSYFCESFLSVLSLKGPAYNQVNIPVVTFQVPLSISLLKKKNQQLSLLNISASL